MTESAAPAGLRCLLPGTADPIAAAVPGASADGFGDPIGAAAAGLPTLGGRIIA